MTVPTVPFYPITHDDGLDIIDALNDLAETENSPSLIAEDFDETKSYESGNYVIYSTLLYRFITSHSAGTWNASHVVQVMVGDELHSFSTRKANDSAIAPEFRNDTNYAVGDVVTYEGGLYRYTVSHTAGNWDREEVVATNAISEGGGGGGGGSWGSITGTLSDQTDLQTALDAKADSADLGTLSSEDDAPSDDKSYGRKNGTWSEIQSGGGGGAWGSITGTLSDQTDLQTALDAKVSSSSPSFTGNPTIASGTVTSWYNALNLTTVSSSSTGTTFTGTIYYRKSGNVVTVFGSNLKLKNQLNSSANVTLITLPMAWRPGYEVYGIAKSNTLAATITVGSGGTVKLTNNSGVNWATSYTFNFTVTYVM